MIPTVGGYRSRGIGGRLVGDRGTWALRRKSACDRGRPGYEIPGADQLTLATLYSTTFLSDISLLLPTSSLLTPSVAYRSISWSHCLTLLNESMSVTS